jgi:hypothetical protein
MGFKNTVYVYITSFVQRPMIRSSTPHLFLYLPLFVCKFIASLHNTKQSITFYVLRSPIKVALHIVQHMVHICTVIGESLIGHFIPTQVYLALNCVNVFCPISKF